MAFSFDSLSALGLVAAAIFSWISSRDSRGGLRLNLRFSAVMLAAFAASLWTSEPGLILAVGSLAGSLAASALFAGFAFQGSAPVWLASFAFSLAFALGAAGALGMPAGSFAVQAGAALSLFAASGARMRQAPRAGFLACLGAASLFLASLALMGGAPGRASLFFAVALLLLAQSSSSEAIGHKKESSSSEAVGHEKRPLQNAVVELEAARDLLIGANRAS